jgi:hypothetical protein
VEESLAEEPAENPEADATAEDAGESKDEK